jgi:hypothetical protein
MEPYARLTAADEVIVRFVFILDQRQVFSKLNDVLVLLHPVVEECKLSDDLAFLTKNRR